MLSDKIKELRKQHGIYQKDLADALSVSKSTVAMWETGKRMPDIDMLKCIASYFKISIDYLLEYTNNTNFINNDNNCVENFENNELEKEITNILNSLNLKDRSKLLTMIYDFADKHKK